MAKLEFIQVHCIRESFLLGWVSIGSLTPRGTHSVPVDVDLIAHGSILSDRYIEYPKAVRTVPSAMRNKAPRQLICNFIPILPWLRSQFLCVIDGMPHYVQNKQGYHHKQYQFRPHTDLLISLTGNIRW